MSGGLMMVLMDIASLAKNNKNIKSNYKFDFILCWLFTLFHYIIMSITKNKWHDEFCDSFPEATKFHTILRNRCLEVDSVNLSGWVRFNCCPSKKCLYVVGYSIAEIFIATLYDYISSSNSIIHSLEFKIPKFGVECIKFKLDMDKITPDFDWEQALPPATLLEKTLRTCYLRYYQNINTHSCLIPYYERQTLYMA